MRFSIVTISFNQGRFLAEAIESVVDQRSVGVDLEYIVVDAGSTDGSRDVLQRFSDQINTIIVEQDGGPADGLNKGFNAATGELLGFLNADDRLEPGALQTAEEFFRRHAHHDVVTGALRIIDGTGQPRRLARFQFSSVLHPPPVTVNRFLADATTFLQPSTFFRRSAWEATTGFNVENRVSWDGELFVDMLNAGARFGRVPKVLASFRIYADSISGARSEPADVRRHHLRKQQDLLASGHHGPRRGVVWMRRLAWWARPFGRIRGWIAGRRKR